MKQIAIVGVPGGWSSERLANVAAERTGVRRLVDLEQVALDLERGTLGDGKVRLDEMDAILVKKAGPASAPQLLERLELLRFVAASGVKVFSDPLRILRTINRVACTVTLAAGGVPMPPTVLTEDPEQARDAVERFGKAVFKPIYSSKARGMRVIEAGPQALERIRAYQAANPVLYAQKLVAHQGRDLALAFLGGEYLGAYARVGGEGAWNTTTRSGGKYQPARPSQEIVDLADKAQCLFSLDFTCVDVVESPDGAQVFEVSAFGGFKGLYEAAGLDAAQLYVDYVLKKC
jgi:ribosomal protein S6--L-glutamate ligase